MGSPRYLPELWIKLMGQPVYSQLTKPMFHLYLNNLTNLKLTIRFEWLKTLVESYHHRKIMSNLLETCTIELIKFVREFGREKLQNLIIIIELKCCNCQRQRGTCILRDRKRRKYSFRIQRRLPTIPIHAICV